MFEGDWETGLKPVVTREHTTTATSRRAQRMFLRACALSENPSACASSVGWTLEVVSI